MVKMEEKKGLFMAILKKKIIENKEIKEANLLDSAFNLFTEKGVKNTSVQDIVNRAGVAKGTFYLYFKDKYEIQDYLIIKKSKQLFAKAIAALEEKKIKNYQERVIFIINFVIDEFIKNKLLLKFISKNLSWAIYSDKISHIIDDSSIGLVDLFLEDIKKNNIKIDNPEVKLFMIIEMTSSTVYTSITNNKPLPIEKYKPILYEEIKKILS